MFFEQVGNTRGREVTGGGDVFHTEFLFDMALHVLTGMLYAWVWAFNVLSGIRFPGSYDDLFETIVLQVALIRASVVIQYQQLPEQFFRGDHAL